MVATSPASMTTMPFKAAVAVAVAVLCLFLSPAMAEIRKLQIENVDLSTITIEKFGFTHSGQVSIALSAVSVTSTLATAEGDRFGFFLLSDESYIQLVMELHQNPNSCVLDSKFIKLLFTFRDLSPPPNSSFTKSFPVTAPNEYNLIFANCAPESQVTMDLHTELYNLDAGGVKDYLSAGLNQIPTIFFLFSLAYFVFLGFWIYICLTNKRSVHRIHLLMAVLLLAKALNLIFAAEDKHYVKITGTPHGWDILFYIFQLIRGVLLFTVIVLIGTGWSFLKPIKTIGTGWSFLKPILQEREKETLIIVLYFQVFANYALFIMGEPGLFNHLWVKCIVLFLTADTSCCCATIYQIMLTIKSLRETSKTDGKAARNLAKLTLFKQFYIVVIGYLYFARIVVFALRIIAAYKYKWVSNAAEEIASLAFYSVIFYMFRPIERNEYFVIDEEEELEAEMALRDEEKEGACSLIKIVSFV